MSAISKLLVPVKNKMNDDQKPTALGNEEPLKESSFSIERSRRRLSVSGNDATLDGHFDVKKMDILPPEEFNAEVGDELEQDSKGSLLCRVFAGKSQRGYVPYNPRKVNQDWMLIKEDTATGSFIFGAFDGHGEHGHIISESISTNFCRNLMEHPMYISNLQKAAIEALQKSEQACISNKFVKTDFSGTTAIICIIRGTTVLTLNVGDSRAIMASEINDECVVTPLSHDHKPSIEGEKERILKAGGRVFSMEYEDGVEGPPRVWIADKDIPGLAMSRSLGDTIAHSVGVLSTPEVVERELTPDDRVIVLGSDGLWEFIDSKECIDMIADCLKPEDAVERLATAAWRRWFDSEKTVDDITVIVVLLSKVLP